MALMYRAQTGQSQKGVGCQGSSLGTGLSGSVPTGCGTPPQHYHWARAKHLRTPMPTQKGVPDCAGNSETPKTFPPPSPGISATALSPTGMHESKPQPKPGQITIKTYYAYVFN